MTVPTAGIVRGGQSGGGGCLLIESTEIMGEAFESFLVGSTRTATTTKPVMFFEKLGEELLRRAFGRSLGGSPDLFSLPLEAHPIGRIALINGRHVLIRCRKSAQDSHRKSFLQAKRTGYRPEKCRPLSIMGIIILRVFRIIGIFDTQRRGMGPTLLLTDMSVRAESVDR